VQTNKTIPNNKLDIIIHENEKGSCMLIDVAISADSNVIKKEAEKILKYKVLTTEIQCMWNVKAKVILVIRGNWNHLIIIQKVLQQHNGKA
jgi:D-Tyr-tRNAtyr deacylase